VASHREADQVRLLQFELVAQGEQVVDEGTDGQWRRPPA